MSYPINYPTPQGANVQIFRGGDQNTTAHVATRNWIKPQGASFVWFTLIGAGGGGGGSALDTATPQLYFGGGGASGNVTNFMCPAFLLPDNLAVAIGAAGKGSARVSDGNANTGSNGQPTKIIYQQKDGTGYQLLIASGGFGGSGADALSSFNNGTGGIAAAADTGGPMTAAGFYQSVGGQAGKNGGLQASVNNLTYVMGGAGYTDNYGGTTTGYYGYVAQNPNGYSQISPIIMAIAGSNAPAISSRGALAAFGCGGNGGGDIASQAGTDGSTGGDGLAIIVTW